MSLHTVKILGISITISPKKEILEHIEKSLKKPLVIVTPNPEQIVLAQHDKQFAIILNKADVAIPDGIGVALVAGVARVAGVELMEDLVGVAAKQSLPVALIGGRGDLAVKTFECLQAKYPGLNGWAIEPEQLQMQEIAKKIEKTGIGMVFVGLGAPKQELFIEQLVHRLEFIVHSKSSQKSMNHELSTVNHIVFMSVGGSFDIIAGRTPRAPGIMRSMGLEWLWRLALEPWRLRRQLALVKFVWLLMIERFTNK